jgi:hypothetical protein
VCIPAVPCGGFAAAAALCCGLEGRPAVAVTDDEGMEAPETGAVLSLAEELGAGVALQVWRDVSGSWSDAGDHVGLLRAELASGEVRVDDVPVRLGETSVLEDVAGRVSAWDSDRPDSDRP